MARVIWNKSDGSAQNYSLTDGGVLGRDAGVDFTVDAVGVSRQHARIEARDSGFFLRDLDSTNGTLLNGRRVVREMPLRSGDEIQIGNEKLAFQCDTDTGRADDVVQAALRNELADMLAIDVNLFDPNSKFIPKRSWKETRQTQPDS